MSAFDDSEICCTILANLPTGLCVVDIHKRILFWSTGAERITGRLRHEVVGHCCSEEATLHCSSLARDICNQECLLDRAIKNAQLTEGIIFLQHKAGHDIRVRVRAVPVHNVHGSIVGAVETFEMEASANLGGQARSTELPGGLDELTGICSKASMQSHLHKTLRSFDEMQVPFAVLCFRMQELDRFRASFGPEAASSLLRVLAQTLKGALWQTDFVGRWNDDQFLVILNGCREDALPLVRERLTAMLCNDSIDWWGERRSLPISVGQATPQLGDTVTSLLERVQNSRPACAETARAAGANSSAADSSPGSK